MKRGTLMVAPVESVAGLVAPLAVSPLMPGSLDCDLDHDVRRQLDADGVAVEEHDLDLEPVDEEALRRRRCSRSATLICSPVAWSMKT